MAKKKKEIAPGAQDEVKEIQLGDIAVLVGGSIPDWLRRLRVAGFWIYRE